MTTQVALAALTTARQLTVHRPAAEPTPEALPDAIALNPARLQAWSSRQRWQSACNAVDPRLVDDPHYPALAAAWTGPRPREPTLSWSSSGPGKTGRCLTPTRAGICTARSP